MCVFLAAMAVMAGWLVLVPLVGCALLLATAPVFARWMQDGLAATAYHSGRLTELRTELVEKQRALVETGCAPGWLEGYARHAQAAAAASASYALRAATVQGVGSAVGRAVALGTLAYGILLIFEGAMTAGGLIGSMMLIFRITGPIQLAFGSWTRAGQLRGAVARLDRLMESPLEPTRPQVRRADGPTGLELGGVSVRYSAQQGLALMGVSARIAPGSVVAIVGGNGSGKSTLLRVLAGLVAPQVGTLLVDGVHHQQHDPVARRAAQSYLPQRPSLFPGTVRENLALAAPGASDEQLTAALALAGLPAQVLDAPAIDEAGRRIPHADRIALARALVRQAPLLLLDNPAELGDLAGAARLRAIVDARRGAATIVFTTSDPDLARLADEVLVLEDGALVYAGPLQQQSASIEVPA